MVEIWKKHDFVPFAPTGEEMCELVERNHELLKTFELFGSHLIKQTHISEQYHENTI